MRQMVRAGAVAGILLAVLVGVVDAQAPTDAELEAAIAAGVKEKKPFGYVLGAEMSGLAGTVCRRAAREGTCAFTIEASGPVGRVRSAAAEQAKRYFPFTLDSVTPEQREPVLVIRATPAPPLIDRGRVMSRAPEATHVVLMPRKSKEAPEPSAIQPLSTETFPVEWKNLVGGEASGQGVVARFALNALPPGDFEIVVISTGEEARYPVQAKHRQQLR